MALRRDRLLNRFSLAVAGFLLAAAVPAQEPPTAWELSTAIYAYAVPGDDDFVNPNVMADRGRLHLEARYNYEEIDTASVWAGANFHVGEQWVFDSTVMLGGVFGEVEGLAPGYRLSLAHGWFELTSEGEYFLDNHDHEENYLFSWTEAVGYPTDWFRAGLALQRTRAYASDLDIQRGVVVGFSYKLLDVSGYVFNPGGADTVYVLGLAAKF